MNAKTPSPDPLPAAETPEDGARCVPVPRDEPERLRRVARLAVSAGQAHPPLDHITALAAGLTGVPIALISIVEDDRQWFLSRRGVELTGTPRRDSFCQFTIVSPSTVAVADTSSDPRFVANPLVLGPPEARSFLAHPLLGGAGHSAVGALCVIDRVPREWTSLERERIVQLAQLAEDYLQSLAMRRAWFDSPLGHLVLDDTGRVLHANRAFAVFTGRPLAALLEQPLARCIAPGDRAAFTAMLDHAVTRGNSPTRRELRFERLTGEVVTGGTSMAPLTDAARQVLCVIRDVSLERSARSISDVYEALRDDVLRPVRDVGTALAALPPDPAAAAVAARVEGHLATLVERLDGQVSGLIARARTEEDAEARERALRVLVEEALGPLLVVDDRGQIADANRAARELFQEADALVGSPLTAVCPGYSQTERQRWLADDAPCHPTAFRRRDGLSFTAEVRAVVTHWNGPARLAILLRGVTGAADSGPPLALDDADAPAAAAHAATLRELRATEAALARARGERDALLKEVHHRVQNNLQIVSSLLSLRTAQAPSPEARAALEEGASRVRSMALIHQQLYGARSLERVDLDAYLHRLVLSLRHALAPDAAVTIDAPAVDLPAEHAVPVGLILHELLTNAFAHGASPAGSGARWQVTVAARTHGGTLRLAVSDRGPGLPPDFERRRDRGLGLRLVQTLARQLHGSLSARTDGGAVFEVTCCL